MTETGSPIKEFIEQVRKQSQEGLEDWEFKAPIELELSTVVSGDIGGGLNISIINLGTKVQSEQIQKIKISIGLKDNLEETK